MGAIHQSALLLQGSMGTIHHQGEAECWWMAPEMAPCSTGLGQDQEDKGWHHCYPISQCCNAGTEPAFLSRSLTLAPYLFMPRYCLAGRASPGMHHPPRGAGGGWYTISRSISSAWCEGLSPLTLTAAAVMLCVSPETGTSSASHQPRAPAD